MKKNIGYKVKNFYEQLPFNYRSSLSNHIKKIKSNKPLVQYPCLNGILNKKISHIDIGCGVGWFVNSLNYNYGVKSTGIDFSKEAILRANELQNKMNLNTKFINSDFLKYNNKKKFDLVSSIGVLHHTHECLKSLKVVIKKYLKQDGYLFLGLYHKYGRKPFLDYFNELKKNKVKEETIFEKFKNLRPGNDKINDKSWFRDQVLHPYETQHSFEELNIFLKKNNLEIKSTSINNFKKIDSIQKIIKMEKKFEKISKNKIKKKIYFPGFFIILAKKIQ